MDYDPTRITVKIGNIEPTRLEPVSTLLIERQCRQALIRLERLYGAFTPRHFEMCFERLSRYRVTRRGNVYDDRHKRTAWATWGFGTIRERRVMAERFAEYMNAEEE